MDYRFKDGYVYHYRRNASDPVRVHPDVAAIEALEKPMLTYMSLFDHFNLTKARLRELGIGYNDVVAIVLPNGPEMALAFLCVAGCATSAPLNPNYREAEFEFYLSDLNAKALILQVNIESAARSVAVARQIPILELVPRVDSPAGSFELRTEVGIPLAAPAAGENAGPDAIAIDPAYFRHNLKTQDGSTHA